MRKNKFNAKKTQMKGKLFDSKKEAHRYLELLAMQDEGKVKGIMCQVKFRLLEKNDRFREVNYIADFVYDFRVDGGFDEKLQIDRTWKSVCEDVKGYRKGAAYQVFKLKQKMLYALHGVEVKEI